VVEDEEEDESEGKYKMVRHHVEKFIKQSRYGKWIDITMAIMSFVSSVAFVVLTYYNLSLLDPCCA
jgi:hypothetical protein